MNKLNEAQRTWFGPTINEAQPKQEQGEPAPVQEPVAWMYTSKWKGNERFITRYQSELTTYKADEVWPLYDHPQPKAEKQEQGEPVGWLDSNDKHAEFMHRDLKAEHDKRGSSTPKEFQIPVYTTPPQRTWVGLTDEEIEQGYETTGHYQKLRLQDKFAVYALAKALDAKLKDKNNA
jgi:hypothetical protein